MTRWDEIEGALGFWRGPLSNFRMLDPAPMIAAGWHGRATSPERWPMRTVEHGFQACKATSREDFEMILAQPGPMDAKRSGRHVTPLRPDWETVKYDIMLHLLRVKFRDVTLRAVLLATGERTLVEASPHDAEWGGWDRQARAWTGANLLGRALMDVRAEISGEILPAAQITPLPAVPS